MNVEKKDVAVLQKGEGKDLVFLHGYLSSKEAFLPLVDYFSRSYRVTALDFCGFGASAPLPYAFSVADYAEWTKRAFYLYGIKNPFCIAHSFGCRVAVKMHAQSAVFERLVLTGPAGIMVKKPLSYYIKVKAYRAVKKIAPAFAEKRFGSKEYRSLSPLMKESYKKIVGEDLREDIKKYLAKRWWRKVRRIR
ncbi:MAG: alpha/beta fold hydrolase [Candidatus Scatosoma sp.]